MRIKIAALAALATLSFTLATLAAPSSAIIVDGEAKTVSIVDLARGSVAASAKLTDAPYRAVLSPDGSVVAVLSRGEGSSSFWTSQFRPTGQSSVTLLDARTLAQISRTDAGWDIGDALFMNRGAGLVVLAPGVVSNKPAEVKTAQLVRIPLAAGAAKRMTLDQPASGFTIAPNDKTGVVITTNAGKDPTVGIRFVDLDAMTQSAQVTIPSAVQDPAASSDGKYIYILEKGNGARKLHVFSTADQREVQTIDAGENPRFAAKDDALGELIVISDGSPDANPRQGALFVVRGTEAQRTNLDFKPEVVRLSDDRRLAYVAGSIFRGLRDAGRVAKIDLKQNTVVGNPVIVMRMPLDLLVSPDGSRAFVSYANYLTVVDLQNDKQLTSFMTGSKGARFGQALMAVGATAASYQSGRSAAQSSGKSSFTYTVYTPKIQAAARGPLAMRRDGKFAYALDTQTHYVTIADAATGERVDNVRVCGGAQELVPLGSGHMLAAVCDSGLSVIDMESNAKVGDDISLPGELRDFLLTPGDDVALALAKGGLVTIDPATGKQLASIPFKRPLGVLFTSR